MRGLPNYLAKVPPEHAGDSNFMAELSLALQPFVDIQGLVNSLPSLFDLDNAIGVQLDATGAWAGISRNIPVPIANPWFAFDTINRGFDQGYWQGHYEGTALVVLDDTTYRRLIRAKIVANASNGLLPSILLAIKTYLDPADYPMTNVGVYDATDPVGGNGVQSATLAMGVIISGVLPNVVDLAILGLLLIPFKPAGVDIIWGVTTVSGDAVFGFDVENNYISGFDVGAWGSDPATVAASL